MMADKNIGSVIVIDGGEMVGIFSERDYARKGILHGRLSKETPVSELMRTEVCYVEPRTSLQECMALMTDKCVRHMPVVENKHLVGVVSIGDVIKQIISEQTFTIKELEKYITGGIDLDYKP